MGRHLGNLSQMKGCFTVPTAQSLDHKGHESDVLATTRFKVFGIFRLLHLLKGRARAITGLLKNLLNKRLTKTRKIVAVIVSAIVL